MALGRTQGSLEYIIIIGGIIILAAATYFMLRGFTQSTGAGAADQIGVAAETLRLELENLGRSEISFSSKSWGSYPQASTLDINNSGSSTSTELTLNNLTDYGLDTDNLEFAYNDSGNMQFLPYTHASPVNVTLPDLGTGITTLLVFHNNPSALELDNVNHSSPEPGVTVEDGTEPVERPDTSPPSVSIPSIVEGPLDNIEIEVNISGTDSAVSESYHSIENSPWIPADNYYYEYGGITSMAYPSDGSYDSENETIRIILEVPSEDNYTVKVKAVDEYGNEKVETQEVEIVLEIPPDTSPPAILSTQPANNSMVYVFLLTINITTDETANCRFSNASGTPYSSMTDFNSTDSTFHQLTNIALQEEQNYKHYFRCNDTSGNVNTTDYLLNFTVADLTPPVVLSAEPSNNSKVTDMSLTINITTTETAHCRFSTSPGTSYSSMNDFNNTDSTTHNTTNASLVPGNYQYYFKCNDTGGNVNPSDYILNFSRVGWGPEIRLSPSDLQGYCSGVAVNGSKVHIVWRDLLDTNSEIFYKNSSDGGITWGSDYRLTNDSAGTGLSRIAISGSNVHVVWRDYRDGNAELYYKNSSDGGTTWSSDYRLTNDPNASRDQDFAVSGSNLHLVWHDTRTGVYEIYYKNSSDGGTTWSSDYALSDTPTNSWYPSVAAEGDNVHAVWHDLRDGNKEVYYKNSSDGGTTWNGDYRLTNAIGVSRFSEIAVSGSEIHVIWWEDRDGNWEIYYKNSSDGGITWGNDSRLTNDSEASDHPTIAIGLGALHVVWQDNRTGNYEVYYKNSSDGGTTWSNDYALSLVDSAISQDVDIAVGEDSIHTLWYDNRSGDWEMYYKKYYTE